LKCCYVVTAQSNWFDIKKVVVLTQVKQSSPQPIDALLGPNGFIERKGPVVVLLIHGLTGTPAEMKHFGRIISRKGISVSCPELSGHCKSVKDLQATRWQDWYASMERAFEALKQEFDQVFIAGLSMGALISMLIAAKKGNEVAGIVSLSTTFFYDGWNVPKYKQKFLLPIVLHTPLKYFLEWEETAPYGIKDERTRALVAAILDNKDAKTADKIGYFKTPATVILESTRLIKAAQKCLPQIVSPTLIVHSTEDDMASIKNAYYVQEHIGAKHVETFFVDDTYHVLTLDKRKDDIAKRVAEFCRQLSANETIDNLARSA
jgi:carboxylesterase